MAVERTETRFDEITYCHSRARGNPTSRSRRMESWMPAFAGMTALPLGVFQRHAVLGEEGNQFFLLEHLAHDIGAADKFALHIELGNGRPVGEGLDAFAHFGVFQ